MIKQNELYKTFEPKEEQESYLSKYIKSGFKNMAEPVILISVIFGIY